MTHGDPALFDLDLAKNYQSSVDDYAISANFPPRKTSSRWRDGCAMWRLFKCGKNQYFFLDCYSCFTLKDSVHFELPSLVVPGPGAGWEKEGVLSRQMLAVPGLGLNGSYSSLMGALSASFSEPRDCTLNTDSPRTVQEPAPFRSVCWFHGPFHYKRLESTLRVCRTPGRASWSPHHLRRAAHNLF